MPSLKTEIGRLRIAGILEGFSWLALIITMILKYGFDMPEPNKVTGIVHGIFFIYYAILTLMGHISHKWSFTRVTLVLLIASFVPFGTFYTEKKILAPMDTNS